MVNVIIIVDVCYAPVSARRRSWRRQLLLPCHYQEFIRTISPFIRLFGASGQLLAQVYQHLDFDVAHVARPKLLSYATVIQGMNLWAYYTLKNAICKAHNLHFTVATLHLTTHATTCSCRSRKRKTHFTLHTFITLRHTPLLVRVDPGNGNSLYFPHFHQLTTHTTTCSCRSRKRKTHFTSHTFITLQHTPLLVHVDKGNGKLTLLSTLSSTYNTHHCLFM